MVTIRRRIDRAPSCEAKGLGFRVPETLNRSRTIEVAGEIVNGMPKEEAEVTDASQGLTMEGKGEGKEEEKSSYFTPGLHQCRIMQCWYM